MQKQNNARIEDTDRVITRIAAMVISSIRGLLIETNGLSKFRTEVAGFKRIQRSAGWLNFWQVQLPQILSLTQH